MITLNKIKLKERLSVDLALRESARIFFKMIEKLPSQELTIDFEGITSISRSFAHEYVLQKKVSHKKIKEVNMPQHVQKMFSVVKNPKPKSVIIDIDKVQIVSL